MKFPFGRPLLTGHTTLPAFVLKSQTMGRLEPLRGLHKPAALHFHDRTIDRSFVWRVGHGRPPASAWNRGLSEHAQSATFLKKNSETLQARSFHRAVESARLRRS